MRTNLLRYQLAACAVAALLSACGGGSATAPGSGSSASSGFAVDGYLSGATVVCDANGNGIKDDSEQSVKTDSSGFFRFDPACTSALVATGGVSIDTGLAFTGTLKAPSGATVITPLTTLIANGGSQSAINSALGLAPDTNLLTADPARTSAGSLVNADLMKKTLVIQQFAQKITEVVAGLATGSADKAAIYSEVMAALAQAIAANPALISGSTISETVSQALIKAAVQRITASSLPANVKAGVGALNPDSLAQVMAGALKVQGENILGATSGNLTEKTKTAQESTAITNFIQTNAASLNVEPNTTTANLASTLKDLISGVTPPPTVDGTLILSFDETPDVFTGMGAYGGAQPTVEAGPSGGSARALKIVKPAGQEPWGGVYFTVPAIPFTADRKVITARVYSTRANATIKFKVEVGPGDSVEVESAAIPANTWVTATWDLSAVVPSKSYTVIAITPDQSITTSGQSYYIDDITLSLAASGGTGGGGSGVLTFSSGFSSAVLTSSNGLVASAGGSDLDGFNCSEPNAFCGSFSGGAGADSYAGFFYETISAPTGLYSQMEVFGPGITGFSASGDTGGITLGSQTKVNFTFNQNPEWFNSSNNKFGVILTLGKRYAIDGGCRLQLHGVKTPTAVTATVYSMNLRNDFRVAADCGAGIAPTDVAAALAASPVVSSVKFIGAAGGPTIFGRDNVASGANLSVAAGNSRYPTTVVLKGAITFD